LTDSCSLVFPFLRARVKNYSPDLRTDHRTAAVSLSWLSIGLLIKKLKLKDSRKCILDTARSTPTSFSFHDRALFFTFLNQQMCPKKRKERNKWTHLARAWIIQVLTKYFRILFLVLFIYLES